MEKPPAPGVVEMWDLPTRLVHWGFVILLPALWWTSKSGRMDVHQVLGHVLLSLLVFRIFWGFAGGSTARFVGFVKGPRAIFDYARSLRGKTSKSIVGHNPLGGWSVVLMLGLLLLQVGLGLISEDGDGLVSGPLAHHVSYETSEVAHDWHEILFNVLLVLVAIHVAAVFAYLVVKRDNLMAPMITGRKTIASTVQPPVAASAWRAAIGAILGAGISYWVWLGCPI